MLPSSADARAYARTRTATGAILRATPPGAGMPRAASRPTSEATKEGPPVKVTEPPGIVLEGFAGPGGWSTGLAMLQRLVGRTLRTVGVEWDRWACLTARAAGHTRVRADVARFDLTAFAGLVWLLLMSPPCQAWSRSGKRKGILDQAAIFAHAMRVTAAGGWIDYADVGPLPVGEGDEGGTWYDARSPLVLEVLRWVLAVQPANICLEQVPDVLPFWELIARWLRGRGYSVWAGCLSAERYGVPQTRERAILIASRERAVSAPPPTASPSRAAPWTPGSSPDSRSTPSPPPGTPARTSWRPLTGSTRAWRRRSRLPCPACGARGRHSPACVDPWSSDGRVYPLSEAS
jgi:site-specific DNA-cytosine methylase